MKTSPIIERVRDQVAAFAGRVAGAAEFAQAAEQEQFPVPHAFVLNAEEEVLVADAQSGARSLTAGQVSQVVWEVFAIVVAVDNTADLRGQAAGDQLDDLKLALHAALIGWSPDADLYSGLEYRGGSHLLATRARLWHEFRYASVLVIGQA